jgi:hypothetical protein
MKEGRGVDAVPPVIIFLPRWRSKIGYGKK